MSIAPFSAFLDEEAARIRHSVCRALPYLALGFLPIACVEAIFAPAAGAAMAAFALCAFFVAKILENDRFPRVAVVVMAALPVAAYVCIAVAGGPAVAIGAWIVVLLYVLTLCLAALHLRPARVLIVGTVAVALLFVAYAVVVRPGLDKELLTRTQYDWPSQFMRAGFLFAFALFAARVVDIVRHGFVAAAKASRASDLFAKYRLERVLGEGGMGTVWAARYCPEGGFVRPVAVKLIHRSLAERPSIVDAFRHEAQVSARLLHKNVVQVLDFGKEGDRWFLAMEYVDGMTLRDLLERARERNVRLDPRLAAWIAREVVSGIAFAHDGATDEQGQKLRLVHRDVAPQNVLISRAGQVKISDFGVAKALGDQVPSGGLAGLVGHVGYLAPEQARGEPVDEKSDLYAVGILLWEMLAGHRLFERTDRVTTVMACADPVVEPPSVWRSELAQGPWDALSLRALAVDPAARFASGREMADALTALLDSGGPVDERRLAALVATLLSADVDDVTLAQHGAPVGTFATPSTGAFAGPPHIDDCTEAPHARTPEPAPRASDPDLERTVEVRPKSTAIDPVVDHAAQISEPIATTVDLVRRRRNRDAA